MQRKSEGIVVARKTTPQNVVGGKRLWGGHDDGSREHKGMVATSDASLLARSQPNFPDLRTKVDNVERLQRRLGAAAKRSEGRRFHALYDRIWRSDVLAEAWKRVMKRVKQRVKELTPNAAIHRDLRETIATINPVLRGWGNYFRTGNASAKFNQVDSYVWMRLRKLVRKRKGRSLKPGEMSRWNKHAFIALGLHKLLGTIRYPGVAQLPRSERPPVSRVRESRTHGLNGGPSVSPSRKG